MLSIEVERDPEAAFTDTYPNYPRTSSWRPRCELSVRAHFGTAVAPEATGGRCDSDAGLSQLARDRARAFPRKDKSGHVVFAKSDRMLVKVRATSRPFLLQSLSSVSCPPSSVVSLRSVFALNFGKSHCAVL